MFSFAKSRATAIFRRRVRPARRAIITARCRGRDTVLRVGIPSRCRYRTRLRRVRVEKIRSGPPRGNNINAYRDRNGASGRRRNRFHWRGSGKLMRYDFFFFVKFLVLVVSRVRISGCSEVLPKRSENVVRFVQFPSAWTRKISIFIQRSN